MKRVIFLVIAALAIFSACTESNTVPQSVVQPSEDFSASFAPTRTELEGTSVLWNENDMLTVFTKTSHNRQYKIKEMVPNRRSATFSYVGYTGEDNTKITTNYALYPYDANARLASGVITTTLAPTQRHNAENGTLSYALMAAVSQDNNFYFKNSVALMRFKVSVSEELPDTYTLKSIKVASAQNKLAGEVTIDLNADTIKAVVTDNGVNEVALTDINATISHEVQQFYLALPATSFDDKDATITFVFEEGEMSFKLLGFNLELGKIKTVIYKIYDPEEFVGNTPDNDDDSLIKEPTNDAIWYTATEKITRENDPEKFGANIVSHEWNSETGMGVIYFDGDVTRIGLDAFIDCDALTSITIPNSVTEIGFMAFHFCDNLSRFNGKFASEDGRCLVVNGSMITLASAGLTSYTIPDTVTAIEGYTFTGCTKLVNITIPDSVTEIRTCAFEGCESLTSITIPDSVISLGSGLFNYCNSLANIRGKYASEDGKCLITDGILNSFARAGMTSYTIPSSVTTIDFCAFESCHELTTITIPHNVKIIGERAFNLCNVLTSIYCKGIAVPELHGTAAFHEQATDRKIYVPYQSVDAYKTANNWSEFADSIIAYDYEKNEIYVDPNHQIRYTAATKVENSSYPWTYDTFGANIIFHQWDSTSGKGRIIFDDDVTKIGLGAFYNCNNLTDITIPEGVTSIGEMAFRACSELTNIAIHNGMTSIGGYAFSGCDNLASVHINDLSAWYNIDFEDNYSNPMSNGAKLYVNNIEITEISIPSDISEIKDFAFNGCTSLVSVTLQENITSIGKSAFSGCNNLAHINIPDGITTIKHSTFSGCNNLANINIPGSLTAIEPMAFRGCSSLTTITIPNGVTNIGMYAFQKCSKLSSVYCQPTTPPVCGEDVFINNAANQVIYVPTASVDAYKTAPIWSQYANAILGYQF